MLSVGATVFGGNSIGLFEGLLLVSFGVGAGKEALGPSVLAVVGEEVDDGCAVTGLLLGAEV